MFRVTVEGDNNQVVIAPEIKALYDNRTARQSAKRILEPLKDEGYERLQFLNRGEVTEFFDKEDALEVLRTPDTPPDSEDEDEPQVIRAWVTVYAPVFDQAATRWRFKFGDSHPYMDISETNIAPEAVKRGEVNVGDSYHVLLEITQVEQESGNFTNRYKIKEVLEFRPGPRQAAIIFEEPENLES